MTGATLAALFSLGPQISAAVLGLPFAHYRPIAGQAPIGSATLISSAFPAWITADSCSKSLRPFVFGKPVGFGLFDTAQTAVGDYLVGALTISGPSETFFIASQDVPAPIQVVRCNHTLSFTRPGDLATGNSYYGGDQSTAETTLATGWPASLMNTGRFEAGEIKLPGDTNLPRMEVLVPSLLGQQLDIGDRIIDETGAQYTIGTREQSALGYRLVVKAAFP